MFPFRNDAEDVVAELREQEEEDAPLGVTFRRVEEEEEEEEEEEVCGRLGTCSMMLSMVRLGIKSFCVAGALQHGQVCFRFSASVIQPLQK